jgi:hypothetical protein
MTSHWIHTSNEAVEVWEIRGKNCFIWLAKRPHY